MTFDAFLSHNSQDKPIVRQLADALVGRRLRPWLDERELVPGRPWQEALEEIIQTTKTAVVMFGPAGLGPWEEPEMRACLNEFVTRKLPVIPVLMPGAPKQPELPLFLKAFTWVDLRGGLSDDGLDRLVWGITGQKPVSLASSAESEDSAVARFVAELTALAKRKPRVEWLTSIISNCCLHFPAAINEEFRFVPLATCIEEAVDHGIQGEEEAGDRWAKRNSLQAVTLILVGLAHAITRSPQALLLITDACETLLKDEKIELRITWPKDGKDELYRMAVETNDPHDESICEFLDENCER
ncbi:MAG: toll/interleukin-1 receptor domain-containing protein [Planctomycetota bacterium]|nr:toll/interleukin-1 receptor domain-containing protein [Planctomycetota bacterium]